MEMKIQTKPSLSMNIVNAETGIGMNVNTGGGSGKVVKQIYKGDKEPTDTNILIWIDTSGVTPSTDIQFITKDGLDFITSDNKNFILKEEY